MCTGLKRNSRDSKRSLLNDKDGKLEVGYPSSDAHRGGGRSLLSMIAVFLQDIDSDVSVLVTYMYGESEVNYRPTTG